MLTKLLKYDFKAVFKYWWIAAISSFVMSVLAGFCLSMLTSEQDIPDAVKVISILFVLLDFVAICAFSIISYILVYVRFYKNFFTDEGYLTFTLPVKRTSLLNSKLIVAFVTMAATGIVVVVNVIATLVIGLANLTSFSELIRELERLLELDVGIAHLAIFTAEALALIVLLEFLSLLFVALCITIAAIIAKKAKIVTAIGIYYVSTGIFSTFVQFFSIIGLPYIIDVFPSTNGETVLSVILFGAIVLIALVCSLLYTFEYWLLDRKLNLA